MKKFICNITLFVIILIVLNLIPNFSRDPYWGNECYSSKFNFFQKNKDRFNVIFLGSSRIHNQINPRVFDRLLSESNIVSFNLGSTATLNPESYQLCEKLLDESNLNLKYIFVGISSLSVIEDVNLKAKKNYYWHTLPYLLYSISSIYNSGMGAQKKISYRNNYIKSYIFNFAHNFINFSFYKELLTQNKNPIKKKGVRKYIGKNKDGFRSRRETRLDFNSDYRELEKRAYISKKAFSAQIEKKDLNTRHLKKLLYLIKKAERKEVRLIFIIPPRLGAYRELLAIKQELPQKNIIELADVNKYPELYQLEYSSNTTHVNKEGADILTKYLAEAFKTIK